MVPTLLTPEEVEDYWALEVPIEAIYVPDELLERPLAENRVEQSHSWSSMGTAETYWRRSSSIGESNRASAVVWPPGHVVDDKGNDHDDRDSYKVLWKPFYSQQERRAIARLPTSDHPRVLAECARVLGALEEAWVRDREREERATYIALLYAPGPIDLVALDQWLAFRTKKDEAHLVAGVRARWFSGRLEDIVNAVTENAGRFNLRRNADRKEPMSREEVRHALVRLMVGLARGRAWRRVELVSNEAAFVFAPTMLTVVRPPRTERTAIEKCEQCRANPSPTKLEPVSATLAFCLTCKTFYAVDDERTSRLPVHEATMRLRAAKNPAFAKWADRKFKQDDGTMDALGALLVDESVPRDHVWEYARASLLDILMYRGLIDRCLARHPDPKVRGETIDMITREAEAGNTRAQEYLTQYPVEWIRRGLGG